MKIKRLAIANRGEVAVRIIHACRELGIESVLLHSDADVQTRAYRMADRTICIGGSAVAESYLNISKVVQGALAAGAQAIHPGFGFLSENADFVRAVVQAGLIFVGPSAEAMQKLGNKVDCKRLAAQARVPLIPGYEGENQETSYLVSQAIAIGFPVIVKAALGGGGRGMKVILNLDECQSQIEAAQREALASFGSKQVFLEKYLDRAKHIEFQIFVDSTGQVIHLYDRECSVQRRHQKIIEEALSPSLTPQLRQQMADCAKKLVEGASYQGAATVEFLLQDEAFYLLEVNTRLQVEHPVTELVLGIDLVKAQILTASGLYARNQNQVLPPHGHAIECRVYAEDPYLGGIPSTGPIGYIEWPEGPGRRFEYGLEAGDAVTSYYDPMIAKVIVWDETRTRAIQKMIEVLKQSIIFGVQTNIPYLIKILSHPEFLNGVMTTQFINQHFNAPLEKIESTSNEQLMFEQIMKSTPKSQSVVRSNDLEYSFNPFEIAWSMEKIK